MRSDTPRPSLFRIVQTDYIALLALVFPIASFGMYIIISYFGYFPRLRGHDPIRGSEGAPFFLYLGTITVLIGIPLLVWRVRSMQAAFARGTEVTGQITRVSFFRDRGRIEYTYDYAGQTYNGGNAIHKTRRAEALREGDEVVLLVDRENPKRALVRDLYI